MSNADAVSNQSSLTRRGGSGYLEALLLHLVGHESLNLLGLEVSPSINKYLPEEHFHYVSGTWATYPGAVSANLVLFVYPRVPLLMERYLRQLQESACDKVIWIGPSLDWADYEPVLLSSHFSTLCHQSEGVAEYEMLVIATK